MTDLDFKPLYEKYQIEAESIMAREKTALMTIPNEGNSLDPEKLAQMDKEETLAFWEKSKCLTP